MANGDAGDIFAERLTPVQKKIQNWVREYKMYGWIRDKPMIIGKVERRMKNYALQNNIALASDDLYLSPWRTTHIYRDLHVQKGIDISEKDLLNFVVNMDNLKLYWDGECFVYTDFVNKYIVTPNGFLQKRKKGPKKANIVNALRLEHPELEFADKKKYKEIK